MRPFGGPRGVIFSRELKGIFSERTILLAIVIQVFVAGFSSFLVVGLASLVDPQAIPAAQSTRVALLDPGGGNPDAQIRDDEILAAALNAARASVEIYRDPDRADEAFQSGAVDALVRIDRDGKAPEDGARLVTVKLADGDLKSTFVLVQVKQALETYERVLRDARSDRLQSEPIYFDYESSGGSYGFVYGLLIPLLVFLPVVLAGALTADSMTEELERGTLPVLLSSPASPADVMEGKVLANALVAPILAAAWMLLLTLNGIRVDPVGALAILAGSLAGAVIMGVLAAAVALLTREAKKAHVVYAMLLVLVLGGSLLLPVSPVNAVARLAAGSATPFIHAMVMGTLAGAIAFAIVARLVLTRMGTAMLLEKPGGKPARD